MGIVQTLKSWMTAGRGVVTGMDDVSEDADPIALFDNWFEAARRSGTYLPEAMAVSTATADGRPSSRMVLLKEFGNDGFVFFTNYESRKADEIEANPNVSLLFHWGFLQRQVRIEGRAERVSRAESEVYFRSRPRGSRIGAWASDQSRVLDRRKTLEDRVSEMDERFSDDVPLPEFWGGYRVLPARIEFWQGRLHRLHDRIVFSKDGDRWSTVRLYP